MTDLHEVLDLTPRTLAEINENIPSVNLDRAKEIFDLFDKVARDFIHIPPITITYFELSYI